LNLSIAFVEAESRGGQEGSGSGGCDFVWRFGRGERGFDGDFAGDDGTRSFGPKKRSTAEDRFQAITDPTRLSRRKQVDVGAVFGSQMVPLGLKRNVGDASQAQSKSYSQFNTTAPI
jgi:hypothetical protein